MKEDDARFHSWRSGPLMAGIGARKGCGCLMELLLLDFPLRDRKAFFLSEGVDLEISVMGRLTLVCEYFSSRAGASFQGHDLEVREPTRAAWRRFGRIADDQRRALQDACGARRGCATWSYGLQPAARALRCGRGASRLSTRGRCGSTRQRLRAPCASSRSMGPAHLEDCEAHRASAPARWMAWSLRFGASTYDRASSMSPPALPRPGPGCWKGLKADPAPLDLLACHRTNAPARGPPCALGDSVQAAGLHVQCGHVASFLCSAALSRSSFVLRATKRVAFGWPRPTCGAALD